MKATNFNIRLSKKAALALIKPFEEPYLLDGKTINCLLDEMDGIELMSKEYGDDGDWVGLSSDDYDTMTDDEYQTFELWLPAAAKGDNHMPHNSSLESDIQSHRYANTNQVYRYTIDTDEENSIVDLAIHEWHEGWGITSDPIASYSYMDEEEAKEDIKRMATHFNINIDTDPYTA